MAPPRPLTVRLSSVRVDTPRMNEGSGRKQLTDGEQRTVSRWVTAEILAGVAVFLAEPFFWLNGLRTALYGVLAGYGVFFLVGFIRLGRLTGIWLPTLR